MGLCVQVDVGKVTTYVLKNLTSLTEYTVGVFAVYNEGEAEATTESFATSRRKTILRFNLFVNYYIDTLVNRDTACPN